MAGLALLPWEKWIAKLLHPLYVAFRRRIAKNQRESDLNESKDWPQVEGVIHQVEWDSSLPREGLRYAYECEKGYYSGLHWWWFDPERPREIRVGDRVLLRYNPESPELSVFINFQVGNSPMFSVFSKVEL